jgi:hypothetical protein
MPFTPGLLYPVGDSPRVDRVGAAKESTPAEVQALHDFLSCHEGRAGLPHGGIAPSARTFSLAGL